MYVRDSVRLVQDIKCLRIHKESAEQHETV